MLPHRDRSALRKIEEELAASDPDFVAALSEGAPPAHSRLWFTTLILADITVVLMIVIGLLAGSTGLFLWGLVSVPLFVWIHRTLLLRKREHGADGAA
ncbi:DUF3040 domain-containing protein [Amycolatopsis sp. FDAARGOS 1241]|uniref:DUF3040 domain-containing protein n=1 Tax=Amycolatopsis sp. FDAARGOS 1241 TaxID=2778070 RepID=UPI0019513765|nr:DUF3040 domain-containing protein [Amycolatopsis sp. FDAARGOS 1241]QRP49106.1 DUF3040 domain-containing protein [Amycolatopsis sp. FDAARGOS 1241]